MTAQTSIKVLILVTLSVVDSRPASRVRTFLDFTDANNIAFAWLVADDYPKLVKTKDPPVPEPAHLHALILDAATGQEKWRQDWATPYYPTFFQTIRDGKFLVCTENTLRLFSSNFELVREKALPGNITCNSPLGGSVSPSRRSLLLASDYRSQNRTYAILDTETLTAVASWDDSTPFGVSATSDTWQVGRCDNSGNICVGQMGRSWRPLSSANANAGKNVGYQQANFIGDMIFTTAIGNEMRVTTVEGTVLFQLTLPNRQSFELPTVSANFERFAVIVDHLRGLQSETLDMYPFHSNDRVLVYSVKDGRAIFALKLNGDSPWPFVPQHENQIALSPGGDRIAVFSDSILRVYRLPVDRP